MKKTLLQSYIDRTTTQHRNQHPREEGIIATLSDIVDRDTSFDGLPAAFPKLQEFHKMLIDRSRVKDDDELERVATVMTTCYSMMIVTRKMLGDRPRVDIMEIMKERIYDEINLLFYDGNDDDRDGNIPINHVGSHFEIAFTEDHGEGFNFKIDATPEAVAKFIKELKELRARLTKEHRAIEDKIYEMTKP